MSRKLNYTFLAFSVYSLCGDKQLDWHLSASKFYYLGTDSIHIRPFSDYCLASVYKYLLGESHWPCQQNNVVSLAFLFLSVNLHLVYKYHTPVSLLTQECVPHQKQSTLPSPHPQVSIWKTNFEDYWKASWQQPVPGNTTLNSQPTSHFDKVSKLYKVPMKSYFVFIIRGNDTLQQHAFETPLNKELGSHHPWWVTSRSVISHNRD